MGHIRLGTLPNTRPWELVVGHAADGAGVAVVAAATLAAAAAGLRIARSDPGFADAVELLALLVAKSRSHDWRAELHAAGLTLPDDPTALEVVLALQHAHAARAAARPRPPSDLAGIALAAAVGTLSRELNARVRSVLVEGAVTALDALRSFVTVKRFGGLFHRFFASFIERFLRYHLDRELSLHFGECGRFHSQDDRLLFERDLATHCSEAALIVKDYAGAWLSKALFGGGVTRDRAARFARHCLDKLVAELAARGAAA